MSNLLQDFLDKNLHLELRGRYELIWINIDNDKTLSDYGKKYHKEELIKRLKKCNSFYKKLGD